MLLDTHVLIWLYLEPGKIGKGASERIEEALKKGRLSSSAISFWETAMLLKRRRVSFDVPVTVWRSKWLSAGLTEIPVTGEVCIVASDLEGLHSDPADRIIIATALLTGVALATADERILAWDGSLERVDPRG